MGYGRSHWGRWNRETSVPLIARGSRRDWIIMGALALLAATQAAFIGNRILGRDSDENEIRVGHDLSQVSLKRADGTELDLADGHNTLLLAFDPECFHSGKVASMWKEWLSAGPRADRVFAFSPGSPPSANAYARDQKWPVEVVSIGTGAAGSRGHALTRRVPWVDAVGGDGRVVAGGHGRKLPEVARALLRNRDTVMLYAAGRG